MKTSENPKLLLPGLPSGIVKAEISKKLLLISLFEIS
jgi:hypothetical protein